MPHQNTTSSKATAQNAATDPQAPNDKGVEQNDAVRPEARSYAAPDYRAASLAAPAAGEMGDYADDGDALGDDGLQQGGTNANRPVRTEARSGHGPKTVRANKDMVRGRA